MPTVSPTRPARDAAKAARLTRANILLRTIAMLGARRFGYRDGTSERFARFVIEAPMAGDPDPSRLVLYFYPEGSRCAAPARVLPQAGRTWWGAHDGTIATVPRLRTFVLDLADYIRTGSRLRRRFAANWAGYSAEAVDDLDHMARCMELLADA